LGKSAEIDWEGLAVPESRKTVLAFGEVLWDILPTKTILGGAPFNFAYRVNSLGDRGLMVSRLGRDELGQKAFDKVVELGLDTAFLQWDDEKSTGTAPITFDKTMKPSFVITPDVAYDCIELTDSLLQAASNADCLCFGTLAQRSSTSRKTLTAMIEQSPQSLKILDINLRKDCYSRESVTSSLKKSDIMKLNDEELAEMAEMLSLSGSTMPDYCRQLLDKWPLTYCLVTLGDKGVFAASKQGEQIHVPGYKVRLADALGSGDAFTAGFINKLLRGETLAHGCEFGNIMGAIVATQMGATAGVNKEDIDEFVSRTTQRIVHPDLEDFILQ
jgi:fructokinase